MASQKPPLRPKKSAETLRKAERLSMELAQGIVDAQLLPGSLLASEHELSASYGVSRPHVRQALQRLAAAGLIETRHGLGSYINPKEHWNLFDPMLLSAFTRSNNLVAIADELIELRRMVELESCRLAALKISETEIAELATWLERMNATLGNTEAIARADIEFHDAIVSASRNRFLQGIM